MQHIITIVPQAGLPGVPDDTASVDGAVLTHNGTDFDLSAIPDGGDGAFSGDHPFAGRITRVGDTFTYRLRMSFDPATAMPTQTRTDWGMTLDAQAVPDLIERRPVEE